MKYSVLVIGGGASGLMAAITAAQCGKSVAIIEKMPRPGRKIMITGKGRCNLTNNCDNNTLIANVCSNSRFLYSAFSSFSAEDTISFFESRGVPLKTERGNRVFPMSDKSVDIVDALVSSAKQRGVKFIYDTVDEVLVENNAVTGIKTNSGSEILGNSVIIATGGLSYPTTGSTGEGFEFAKKLGHTVTRLRPSLVPFEVHEGYCSLLTGLSLKNVSFTLKINEKEVFKEQGEMLFTHFGVSGPLVLSASASVADIPKEGVKGYIDLKPALSAEQLDKRLLRDFAGSENKEILGIAEGLMPKKLAGVVLKLAKIEGKQRVNSITREQRESLIKVIKALPLTVTGLRPFSEAIITKGGVSVKEINPKTMESKLISGLYFAGEVIDVDAFTGGFNLQIAFSTGYLAGLNA